MKKHMVIPFLAAGLLLCTAGTRTRGQAPQALSFRPGEELTYTASYSAAILTTDVATITFKTSTDRL